VIACSACSARHVDACALPLVGWLRTGVGELAVMRRCVCGRAICSELLVACLCRSCATPIRGIAGDPKIVIERHDGTSAIYCRWCAKALVFEGGVDALIEGAREDLAWVAAGGSLGAPMLRDAS
jgi:hypothetical protein